MTREGAERLVRTLQTGFERDDVQLALSVYSPDVEIDAVYSFGPKRVVTGIDELRVYQQRLHDSFPAPRVSTANIVVEGDTMVVEWDIRGGDQPSQPSVAVYELRGDLVVRERMYFDRKPPR